MKTENRKAHSFPFGGSVLTVYELEDGKFYAQGEKGDYVPLRARSVGKAKLELCGLVLAQAAQS